MKMPINPSPWLTWQRIFLGLSFLILLSGLAKAEEESSQPVEIANHGLDLNYMASEAGVAWIIQGVEIDGMGLADLDVAQVEVFAPDASIIIDDGLPTYSVQDPPNTRFLRGEIVGIPGSVVALMQTDEGMISGLMTDGDVTWRVYRSSLTTPLETAPVDSDAATMKKPFACGNEQLPDPSLWQKAPVDAMDPPPSAELPAGQLYQATVAIETDYEFFALFGNTAAATNYIGNLYNYISGIYETEIQTRFLVGSVFLWTTTADPWVETSGTSCRLYEFGRYWRDNRAAVPRTLAHFLSGAPLGGGVAWLDQLCAPANSVSEATGCTTIGSDLVYGGFGVSANLSGSISTAAGPAWDAVVVAHEMGHNFSSPHTHCYNNVGGNASPVDACWSAESGCWSGATSLPGVDSLTGGTASSRNGTLMSYCHQQTGGIANIAGSFGLGHPYGIVAQRVPDKMLNRIAAVASSNPSCIPVIALNSYTVTATAGPNGAISPPSRTVADGATTTFTVTPDAGYSASASGCGGSLSGANYTTGPITANCTVSATFSLIPTLPLGEALDNTSLAWTTGGNASWYGQTAISHDGADAAQSGDIADSQNSWMQTALTGPGTLSFYWSVSSEANSDFLRFYIDDAEQSGSISGAVDWQQQSRDIPSGTHTVKWAYTKDGSLSSSSDAAWVDQVVYAPNSSTSTAIGIYRPSTHRFYLDVDGSGTWNGGDASYSFGSTGDVPIIGDWNGDGTDEIGVYRPSRHRFYLDVDGSGTWNGGDASYSFGSTGDVPIIGDWNGDGTDEIGVYRPSRNRFYLDVDGSGTWNGGDASYSFGSTGDVPIIGDWNGDGTDEIGVYRPSRNRFYLDVDGSGTWNGGDASYSFGSTGDIPIIGDWNGDGTDEIGVYRPSTHRFYLDVDGSGSWNGGDASYSFGSTGDVPIVGAW